MKEHALLWVFFVRFHVFFEQKQLALLLLPPPRHGLALPVYLCLLLDGLSFITVVHVTRRCRDEVASSSTLAGLGLDPCMECCCWSTSNRQLAAWQVWSSSICNDLLCCAVLCCAVLCCAVLCCAVLCSTPARSHQHG
jgi:hypothetical protein